MFQTLEVFEKLYWVVPNSLKPVSNKYHLLIYRPKVMLEVSMRNEKDI